MPPPTDAGTDPSGHDRERRVLRRAALVGGGVGTAFALTLSVGVVAAGGGGALGLAAVAAAGTVGVLVAAGWLLLSLLLDLLAGRTPPARRLWWALGLTVAGFAGPIVILGALAAATR